MPEGRMIDVERRFRELGDAPPLVDLSTNDAAHDRHGAHTLDRHGPDIPLQRDPRTKTIEGRIHGDHPWLKPAPRSYRWIGRPAMNRAVNAYLRRQWQVIRIDLALRGAHRGGHDAGALIGHGFAIGADPARAEYGETTTCTIVIRLVPGGAPTTPFILTAYPRCLIAAPARRHSLPM